MSESQAPPAAAAKPQRLYFHVGLPKSGSTYLQMILGNNRTRLKEHGHVYPYVRQEGMFYAAVEMVGREATWGLDPDDIGGTFAHLLRRGRRLGGTVVISHEIFGAAGADRIAVMAEMLADFDVHLVVTARDLGRTITAEWQEGVKNGNPASFADFAGRLLEGPPDPADDKVFWRSQNLVELLRRWQAVAPPERMHLVTTPRRGAAPDLLWRRFADAIELPADAVDLSQVPVRNESLGTAQVALLRKVLTALDGRLEQPWYSRVVKRWFAQTLLSTVPSPKPVTPASVTEQLALVSHAWVEEIRAGGYQVHGDLDELLPEPVDGTAPDPDRATDADMVQGLPEVIAEMLLRTGQLQADLAELRRDHAALEVERDELVGRIDELTTRRHRWWPLRVVPHAPRDPGA